MVMIVTEETIMRGKCEMLSCVVDGAESRDSQRLHADIGAAGRCG